jgi:hypothetical protein
MSWTTFAFTPNQMFTDYNHYTPTTLNNNWVCDSPPPLAGDGDIIKAYLLNGLQSFTPTPTP